MFKPRERRVKRKPRVKIGEWLRDHFTLHPDSALTTTDVILRAQGAERFAITKSQRVSTIRAMKALPPPLRTLNGEGNCGQLIIYNSHNLRSYALAWSKANYMERYQYQNCRRLLSGNVQPLWDEAKLIAGLEIPVQDSGDYLEVQKFIALDKGDKRLLHKIEAQEKVRATALSEVAAEFRKRQAKLPRPRRGRPPTRNLFK